RTAPEPVDSERTDRAAHARARVAARRAARDHRVAQARGTDVPGDRREAGEERGCLPDGLLARHGGADAEDVGARVSVSTDLQLLLARIVEHHTATGVLLPVEEVAAGRPELAAPLAGLVRQYLQVLDALDGGSAVTGSLDGATPASDAGTSTATSAFVVDGFRTIERLGAGGMGEVYKLHDLTLDRIVAAKVIRRKSAQATGLGDFLREARSLALFSDPRVVRIFEYREAADPPVIIMEYVEGFELGRLGPSLEFRQRARILREICAAIHHAHSLG